VLFYSCSSPNYEFPIFIDFALPINKIAYLFMIFSGVVNASVQGAMARIKGPFTPSQWMELEHQALIYKYLAASVPIPPSVLLPLRRSLTFSGFTSPFPSAYLGSSSCKLF
jgi:QLQ